MVAITLEIALLRVVSEVKNYSSVFTKIWKAERDSVNPRVNRACERTEAKEDNAHLSRCVDPHKSCWLFLSHQVGQEY